MSREIGDTGKTLEELLDEAIAESDRLMQEADALLPPQEGHLRRSIQSGYRTPQQARELMGLPKMPPSPATSHHHLGVAADVAGKENVFARFSADTKQASKALGEMGRAINEAFGGKKRIVRRRKPGASEKWLDRELTGVIGKAA